MVALQQRVQTIPDLWKYLSVERITIVLTNKNGYSYLLSTAVSV